MILGGDTNIQSIAEIRGHHAWNLLLIDAQEKMINPSIYYLLRGGKEWWSKHSKIFPLGNQAKDIWEFFVLFFQCFFKSKIISKQNLKVKKIKEKKTPWKWKYFLTQALASLISNMPVSSTLKFSDV